MFYPVDSLKRGGRFYLLWVADSWPLRFAAITHRQLWSQDIRQLCDDLLEVITNESGRPTNRFSLRLSSQLMRGLVRLYERKATVLLGDLCMINAHVFKSTNKKLVPHEERPQRRLPQLPAAPAVVEEPEEQRVEELIQNSGNAVNNIQDITLKEAVIPDFQLPPNDNFGEENPDQPLQALLADRTIEMMMQETSHAQLSGLDQPTDKSADKSHDKSRPALLDVPQMDSLSLLDVTSFRKSAVEVILPTFEKEVPEVPEVQVPELPAPTEPFPIPEIRIEPPEETPAPPPEPEVTREAEVPTETRDKPLERDVPVDVELEELEQQPAARRRGAKGRARTSLIVDKRIKLSSEYMRARLNNPGVETRCEDFTDAIIRIRVPYDMLAHHPAHAGPRAFPRMSPLLARLYMRNLSTAHGVPFADRVLVQVQETEEPRQRRTRSPPLEKIPEAEEPQPPEPPAPAAAAALPPTARAAARRLAAAPDEMMNITAPNITAEVLNVSTGPLNVSAERAEPQPQQMEVDIADLPTQKLETLSQVARKRPSEYEPLAKRQRSLDSASTRVSQKQKSLQPPEIILTEPDKENIPPNIQEQEAVITEYQPPQDQPAVPMELSQADAVRLLQEAGLSNVQQYPEPQGALAQERARKASNSSETPLGSLDKTKVSLGDSTRTTDTQRFIRNQWGIEGTMTKIMLAVAAGGAVTVSRLVAAGPLLPGLKSVIAARCFTAILKLKQYEFIRIVKDPHTLEIRDITLGRKFDGM